jgi:hypothetical protein
VNTNLGDTDMLFDAKRWTEPAEVVTDPDANVLLAAAALIESKGWIQGEAENEDGYCIIGAVHAVVPKEWSAVRICERLSLLVQTSRDPDRSIEDWNDLKSMRRGRVLKFLRDTAVKWNRK